MLGANFKNQSATGLGIGEVITGVKVAHAAQKEASKLYKESQPKVGLSFRHEVPPCDETLPGISPEGEDFSKRVFRVQVHNLTSEPLDDVTLKLECFEPALPALNRLPLHIMHDNGPGPANTSFNLGANDDQYIDVVMRDSRYQHASVCTATTGIPPALLADRYELVLRCQAKTVAPRYWRFVIANQTSHFDFHPYGAADLDRDPGSSTPPSAVA